MSSFKTRIKIDRFGTLLWDKESMYLTQGKERKFKPIICPIRNLSCSINCPHCTIKENYEGLTLVLSCGSSTIQFPLDSIEYEQKQPDEGIDAETRHSGN